MAIDLQAVNHRVFHVYCSLKLPELLHVLPCFHLKTEQLACQHAHPKTMDKQQTVIGQGFGHAQELIHPRCKHGKAVGSRPISVVYIAQHPIGLRHASPLVHTHVGNVGSPNYTTHSSKAKLAVTAPIAYTKAQRFAGYVAIQRYKQCWGEHGSSAQAKCELAHVPRSVKTTCLSGTAGPPTFAVLSPWRIKYKVCNTRCSSKIKR